MPSKLFELQGKLYRKAKEEPGFRFYSLFGLMLRRDVLTAAWDRVARNNGCPGVDGVTADFLECSHGFRPGRSAHQALREVVENVREGKGAAYDADLSSYFDTIPHDKLRLCVEKRIVDRSVLALIRLWLKADVEERDENGGPSRRTRPTAGTPQGGVISPLLANLYLHWFDKLFHRNDGPRGWANARLVRYADDCAPRRRERTDYVQLSSDMLCVR